MHRLTVSSFSLLDTALTANGVAAFLQEVLSPRLRVSV